MILFHTQVLQMLYWADIKKNMNTKVTLFSEGSETYIDAITSKLKINE